MGILWGEWKSCEGELMVSRKEVGFCALIESFIELWTEKEPLKLLNVI